jgi:hypothetical protein
MQLVHNDALLDSSIYGLSRCARSSINSTRPIKQLHYGNSYYLQAVENRAFVYLLETAKLSFFFGAE